MILTNHKQNQRLTELRDWLLPMLMNGQVRVGGKAAEIKPYTIEEQELPVAAEPGEQRKNNNYT